VDFVACSTATKQQQSANKFDKPCKSLRHASFAYEHCTAVTTASLPNIKPFALGRQSHGWPSIQTSHHVTTRTRDIIISTTRHYRRILIGCAPWVVNISTHDRFWNSTMPLMCHYQDSQLCLPWKSCPPNKLVSMDFDDLNMTLPIGNWLRAKTTNENPSFTAKSIAIII
jgi:hypothetical protein